MEALCDLKFGTTSEWLHHYPLQEGAGTTAYDVIGSAHVTFGATPTRVVSTIGSHYNSRIGHKHDGTRNVPAKINNQTEDALGNSIGTFDKSVLSDRYAEVDFDPQSSIELSSLANDWQIGDTASAPLYVDQSISNEEKNFTLYKETPTGTRITNVQSYHNI